MFDGNYGVQRKGYSRFTASAAKGIVKKKILEIRRNGARAADEFIDQLLKNNEKSQGGGSNRHELADFEAMIRSTIEKDRSKWRNFMIEVAMSFDPDALACFGVNFIYGGLITASAGNVGWASMIEIGEKPTLTSNENVAGTNKLGGMLGRARAVSETVAKGRARGNMVWILKGRGLFNTDIIKSYRFEPDVAFILMEEPDKKGIWYIPETFDELSGLKNVLSVLPEGANDVIYRWSNKGMLYGISSFEKRIGEGNRGGASADISRGVLPTALEKFIRSPSIPIRTDGMISIFDGIESIFSNGKAGHIPVYRI